MSYVNLFGPKFRVKVVRDDTPEPLPANWRTLVPEEPTILPLPDELKKEIRVCTLATHTYTEPLGEGLGPSRRVWE